MKSKKYQNISKQLDEAAKKIMVGKQPEYTNNSTDVLHNFKSSAKMLDLQPLEVWAVFFHKHVQAIMSHAHNPGMYEAEPIESRYADAINYLHLGYALTKERQQNLNKPEYTIKIMSHLQKKYKEMMWWKTNHPELKLKIQKMQQNLDEEEKKHINGNKKNRTKNS